MTTLGTRSWFVRSQNCCVAFSMAQPRRLAHAQRPARRVHGAVPVGRLGGHRHRRGRPSGDPGQLGRRWCRPGRARSRSTAAGPVVRLFSTGPRTCWRGAATPTSTPSRDPNVTPFAPWPDPADGHRVRVYRLADIPADPGRFGRILRCSTIMVNYFYVDDGAARSASAVAPSPRRLRADLAPARGRLRAPHPHAVDGRSGRLARRRAPVLRQPGRHDHPAAHGAHQPERRPDARTS